MYGEYEAAERDKQVRKTMKGIRHCLTERWYAWENARVAGMEDPEVDLYADLEKGEAAYLPRSEESTEVCADARLYTGRQLTVTQPVFLGSEDDARTDPDPKRTLPQPTVISRPKEARV